MVNKAMTKWIKTIPEFLAELEYGEPIRWATPLKKDGQSHLTEWEIYESQTMAGPDDPDFVLVIHSVNQPSEPLFAQGYPWESDALQQARMILESGEIPPEYDEPEYDEPEYDEPEW